MSSNPPVLGLLRRVYLSGGIVEIVDGGMLGLTGQPCPEHLKADLKEHKAAVLDTLKEQRIGERDDGLTVSFPGATSCPMPASRTGHAPGSECAPRH